MCSPSIALPLLCTLLISLFAGSLLRASSGDGPSSAAVLREHVCAPEALAPALQASLPPPAPPPAAPSRHAQPSLPPIDFDSPQKCPNAQRHLVPKADIPFGPCASSPGFDGTSWEHWHGFGDAMMAINCTYARSKTQRLVELTPRPLAARVYLVYAMSENFSPRSATDYKSPPFENPGQREVRRGIVRSTLKRLRAQFGPDALELVVVQVDDGPLDEDLDFGGAGVVNTLITDTWREGQDFAAYQDGLHYAWDRLDAFDWVLVLNDQMAGPVAFLPDTLALATAARAALWATISDPDSDCLRGYCAGFSRELVSEPSWRLFFERMYWPCGKMGPMMLGEGGMTQMAATGWHKLFGGCAASAPHVLGKGWTLAQHRDFTPNTAFIYRWGIEHEFTPEVHRGKEGGFVLTAEEVSGGLAKAVAWLEAQQSRTVIEDCQIGLNVQPGCRELGPKLAFAEAPRRPGAW